MSLFLYEFAIMGSKPEKCIQVPHAYWNQIKEALEPKQNL